MDSILGIHETALLLREKRTELIANNIANADTPGFKARDISFESILKHEMGQGDFALATTHQDHQELAIQKGSNLLYRMPTQFNLDGNTVDSQTEQSEFAQNSLHYMASLNFINQRIHQMMIALKGE